MTDMKRKNRVTPRIKGISFQNLFLLFKAVGKYFVLNFLWVVEADLNTVGL